MTFFIEVWEISCVEVLIKKGGLNSLDKYLNVMAINCTAIHMVIVTSHF